jgi:Xaa-Pro aminopeptidase
MRLISGKKIQAILGRLKRLGVDAAVFVSQEPLVDSNIQYLSGFGGMLNGVLVLAKGRMHLLTTQLDYDRALEEAAVDDVCRIGPEEKARHAIKPLVSSARKIGIVKSRFTVAELSRLGLPLSKLVDIERAMREERAVKEEGEIEALKRSANISNRGIRFLREFIRPGVRENEISAGLESEIRSLGSERTPFDVIVTSGRRSSVVHPCPPATKRKVGRGLGLVDFGSVYRGYVTDVTVPFLSGSGLGLARERRMAATATSTFDEIAGMIRPGVSIGSLSEAYEKGIKGNGFKVKHSLGHGIGLDTHDSPSLAKEAGRLATGMVIAVEPGVYERGIGGCRLENDVLVTKSGASILTKSKLIRI